MKTGSNRSTVSGVLMASPCWVPCYNASSRLAVNSRTGPSRPAAPGFAPALRRMLVLVNRCGSSKVISLTSRLYQPFTTSTSRTLPVGFTAAGDVHTERREPDHTEVPAVEPNFR